jgi:hypothetical protein
MTPQDCESLIQLCDKAIADLRRFDEGGSYANLQIGRTLQTIIEPLLSNGEILPELRQAIPAVELLELKRSVFALKGTLSFTQRSALQRFGGEVTTVRSALEKVRLSATETEKTPKSRSTPYPRKASLPKPASIAVLTHHHQELLVQVLEQSHSMDDAPAAKKFRADHHESMQALDELERMGFLRRSDEQYVVSGTVIPFLESPLAEEELADFEALYSALRDHYRLAQDERVLVTSLAVEIDLPLAMVSARLRRMTDVATWCGGYSSDFEAADSFVVPSEGILRNHSFFELAYQVNNWSQIAPQSPIATPAQLESSAPEESNTALAAKHQILPAWPAVRACLGEFSFSDIKTVAGLAGANLPALAHLDQREPSKATKGHLMTAVDGQYGAMSDELKARFLANLIEEILRRRPEAEDLLSEYLSRLGWSFIDRTLVATNVLSHETLEDTPPVSRADLLKAAQRLRVDDLSGAISAACGAVDSATSQVYADFKIGDPTDDSFQQRCKRAMKAKGVMASLEQELQTLGWEQTEVTRFRQNLDGAFTQGAYVMQTLRSHMGDVHGSKPISRPLVFDCLRWAELIVGSLVDRSNM